MSLELDPLSSETVRPTISEQESHVSKVLRRRFPSHRSSPTQPSRLRHIDILDNAIVARSCRTAPTTFLIRRNEYFYLLPPKTRIGNDGEYLAWMGDVVAIRRRLRECGRPDMRTSLCAGLCSAPRCSSAAARQSGCKRILICRFHPTAKYICTPILIFLVGVTPNGHGGHWLAIDGLCPFDNRVNPSFSDPRHKQPHEQPADAEKRPRPVDYV